mgnify:CR=1 FL=1
MTIKAEYTTDELEFHLVTLFDSKTKKTEMFYAKSKIEVRRKFIDWINKNTNIPFWKIKIDNYRIGLN